MQVLQHLVFLGYTTIILALITIIKFRPAYTWFWVLICGVFTIFSFGPELKFFNVSAVTSLFSYKHAKKLIRSMIEKKIEDLN